MHSLIQKLTGFTYTLTNESPSPVSVPGLASTIKAVAMMLPHSKMTDIAKPIILLFNAKGTIRSGESLVMKNIEINLN